MRAVEQARHYMFGLENGEKLNLATVKGKDPAYWNEFCSVTDRDGNTPLLKTYMYEHSGFIVVLDQLKPEDQVKVCRHTNKGATNIFMLDLSLDTLNRILEYFPSVDECRTMLTAVDKTGKDAITYAAYNAAKNNKNGCLLAMLAHFPDEEWPNLLAKVDMQEWLLLAVKDPTRNSQVVKTILQFTKNYFSDKVAEIFPPLHTEFFEQLRAQAKANCGKLFVELFKSVQYAEYAQLSPDYQLKYDLMSHESCRVVVTALLREYRHAQGFFATSNPYRNDCRQFCQGLPEDDTLGGIHDAIEKKISALLLDEKYDFDEYLHILMFVHYKFSPKFALNVPPYVDEEKHDDTQEQGEEQEHGTAQVLT